MGSPIRVMECRTGQIRYACPDRLWGVAMRTRKAGQPEPFPEGHCMFERPYAYGCWPVGPSMTAEPLKDSATLAPVRAWMVETLRAYSHAWREARISGVWPEGWVSDARWGALQIAKFMRARGIRFAGRVA